MFRYSRAFLWERQKHPFITLSQTPWLRTTSSECKQTREYRHTVSAAVGPAGPWGLKVPQCPHCLSHVNWVAAPLQEQPELGHRNGNSSFADLLVCVKEALAEQEVSANPDGILPYVPYVRVTEKRVSSRRNGRHWEGFSLFLYKES